MRFKCRPADFLRELEFVAAVAHAKNKISHPVLGHVLIEACASGVQLTTNDLRVALRSTVAVPVEEAGTCSADAKQLLAWLKCAVPYKEVTFETDATGEWLHTSFPHRTGKFEVIRKGIFAPVENPVALVNLPAAELNTMVARTVFAVSNDEQRYAVTGVLFDVMEKGTMRMVATDSNRLAIAAQKLESGATTTALVPVVVLNQLPRMAADGVVTFGQSETNLFFAAGARSITGRRMSGTFPTYEGLLPNEFDLSFFAEINGAVLKEALVSVLPFTDDDTPGVLFNFANGELSLATRHGSSVARVLLLGSSFTEPFAIILNGEFVMDFLKQVDGNSLIVRLIDANSVATFEDGPAYTYYVMPMKPDPD